MIPEISHRCPSCGAAVRDGNALFCPECGKALTEKATASEAEPTAETVSSNAETETAESVAPESSLPESDAIDAERAETSANDSTPAATEATVPAKDEAASHPVHRRGDKTRERLHRAGEVARGVTRGVIEEPAKRVEKIRHASTVVIEEASYDPSLRFVLVALALFVVCVILLVLSKVMG